MSRDPWPIRAGWALFHPYIAVVDQASAADSSATAVSKTSNGLDVGVFIRRLVTPPARSCLQLYTDDKVSSNPTIVAADGDRLLIHTAVPVRGRPLWSHRQNFFVFKADPDFPWMQPLPPPPRWSASCQDTRIACSGGEGFVVANFRTCRVVIDRATMREGEAAVLRIYRSATEERETKNLEMHYDPEKGLVEYKWTTDAVFSVRGFVCWVDYHLGILYCDVFSPDPDLAFRPFPGIDTSAVDVLT
ncbi:hypothetical protein QOZ80_3AG0212600 [Eleusine coracana subsp. coracana]|nr:hypothetical protein QOZ80_3AG0212600 [Eleusine coracana subsp. coracana]